MVGVTVLQTPAHSCAPCSPLWGVSTAQSVFRQETQRTARRLERIIGEYKLEADVDRAALWDTFP
jgi:hypothetical protein